MRSLPLHSVLLLCTVAVTQAPPSLVIPVVYESAPLLIPLRLSQPRTINAQVDDFCHTYRLPATPCHAVRQGLDTSWSSLDQFAYLNVSTWRSTWIPTAPDTLANTVCEYLLRQATSSMDQKQCVVALTNDFLRTSSWLEHHRSDPFTNEPALSTSQIAAGLEQSPLDTLVINNRQCSIISNVLLPTLDTPTTIWTGLSQILHDKRIDEPYTLRSHVQPRNATSTNSNSSCMLQLPWELVEITDNQHDVSSIADNKTDRRHSEQPERFPHPLREDPRISWLVRVASSVAWIVLPVLTVLNLTLLVIQHWSSTVETSALRLLREQTQRLQTSLDLVTDSLQQSMALVAQLRDEHALETSAHAAEVAELNQVIDKLRSSAPSEPEPVPTLRRRSSLILERLRSSEGRLEPGKINFRAAAASVMAFGLPTTSLRRQVSQRDTNSQDESGAALMA
ncbi:hypothetical protein Ae201684P_004498 [Aphanomyces euteiches]|uniref:Uncharacterized protein n=1 Tax=Aphanomyces euteiches TaxID=100861 RepID=A0A6G0WKM5_9STRA|nr:hypothetical protein Ae201684_014239 [Aphanomyces euteiches]KAH9068797.1 hypothetical protein Ae201684P_004498 [Aphanomyces euteiches]KAH9156772.1 hypothetical protein AeRB84_001316 [Aphanomyces euteiches]